MPSQSYQSHQHCKLLILTSILIIYSILEYFLGMSVENEPIQPQAPIYRPLKSTLIAFENGHLQLQMISAHSSAASKVYEKPLRPSVGAKMQNKVSVVSFLKNKLTKKNAIKQLH